MAMPLGPNGIDLIVLAPFRLERIKHSIANGRYFTGPFFQLAINNPATYQFIYRYFANHTAETPERSLYRRNT
jgi:hypothetical protein